MNHARHTIFGAAALSRGLACLLLTLCLIPGAATTAQAFEAGRHAAPPQGAESEYEQQMRTQRILQMLDDFERLITMQDGTKIPMDDILTIESDAFSSLEQY